MKTNVLTAVAVLAVAVVIVFSSSVFTVDQRQQAIVLQFGKRVRIVENPGLQFKVPFIQNVILIDKRVLDLDPPLPGRRRPIRAVAHRLDDPAGFAAAVAHLMEARA